MKIVVLAGGLSTERDVSFKTGDMVAKALRENGHQVILLDVFMGYSDKKELEAISKVLKTEGYDISVTLEPDDTDIDFEKKLEESLKDL